MTNCIGLNDFELKNMEHIRDKELILALKQGDIRAYEDLFRCRYDYFLRFAKRILKDDSVSEDILQNVFLKVWENRQNLDETMSIHNYLFVLVKNQIFSYLRSKKNFLDIAGEDDFVFHSYMVDEIVEANEMDGILVGIIDSFPPQRKTIFKLSRFDQLPDKLIAEKMKLSVRTVEKHIQLALRDIRCSMNKVVAMLF